MRSVYTAPAPAGYQTQFNDVFTEEAKLFVAELYTTFRSQIDELYRRRVRRKVDMDTHNTLPDFLKETQAIRDDPTWKVAPVPERVRCRKIDCGDVSPSSLSLFKQALNSKANGIQVDFDDGHCPSWTNQISGYWNIMQFVSGHMSEVPAVLQAPVLMLRPRAWNMVEHNVVVDGTKVPGPVVDFAILMYHISTCLYTCGSGPFFYLSKLEGYLEARLWKDMFVWAERKLKLPHGSIKACVLIENILSTFEMEEILYELREHSLGLNCGIWDYCASIINKFGARQDFRLPDRSKSVNMHKHFLKSYCKLVIDVCHRRGAHATGGMNARVLPQGNSQQIEEITQQVCSAKRMEAELGVDGFLVFDVRLVPAAKLMIDDVIPGDNQCGKREQSLHVTASDLLTLPEGSVTRSGLIINITVGILFIKYWLQGKGLFIYNGSVEDSATAEISRSQVWQWLRHEERLEENGEVIDTPLLLSLVDNVIRDLMLNQTISSAEENLLITASQIFVEVVTKRDFPEFITTYLNESHTWLSQQHLATIA